MPRPSRPLSTDLRAKSASPLRFPSQSARFFLKRNYDPQFIGTLSHLARLGEEHDPNVVQDVEIGLQHVLDEELVHKEYFLRLVEEWEKGRSHNGTARPFMSFLG